MAVTFEPKTKYPFLPPLESFDDPAGRPASWWQLKDQTFEWIFLPVVTALRR